MNVYEGLCQDWPAPPGSSEAALWREDLIDTDAKKVVNDAVPTGSWGMGLLRGTRVGVIPSEQSVDEMVLDLRGRRTLAGCQEEDVD